MKKTTTTATMNQNVTKTTTITNKKENTIMTREEREAKLNKMTIAQLNEYAATLEMHPLAKPQTKKDYIAEILNKLYDICTTETQEPQAVVFEAMNLSLDPFDLYITRVENATNIKDVQLRNLCKEAIKMMNYADKNNLPVIIDNKLHGETFCALMFACAVALAEYLNKKLNITFTQPVNADIFDTYYYMGIEKVLVSVSAKGVVRTVALQKENQKYEGTMVNYHKEFFDDDMNAWIPVSSIFDLQTATSASLRHCSILSANVLSYINQSHVNPDAITNNEIRVFASNKKYISKAKQEELATAGKKYTIISK